MRVRAIGIVVSILISGAIFASPAAAAAGCDFTQGFKTMHDNMPAVVGDCLENEHDGGAGSRVQQTSKGMLVWRPADNWVKFTDGFQTWVNGPYSVQQRLNTANTFPWEAPQTGGDAATPIPHNKGIIVSLRNENMSAYEDGKLVVQTPVTTGGLDSPTPVGTYTVLTKQSNFIMKSSFAKPDPRWYPDSFVNFGMLIQSQGYFIHDAPWRDIYGPDSNLLYDPVDGWQGTHGCVNVPYKAEAQLFAWADVGTPVWVVA